VYYPAVLHSKLEVQIIVYATADSAATRDLRSGLALARPLAAVAERRGWADRATCDDNREKGFCGQV
jgi:hypothetical protein